MDAPKPFVVRTEHGELLFGNFSAAIEELLKRRSLNQKVKLERDNIVLLDYHEPLPLEEFYGKR